MDASYVLEKHKNCVVIVHYRIQTDDTLYNGGNAPQNPACLLQVTLLQDKISPSGKLIRLGETRGDEITGWTKLEALEVVEALGILADDGATVTPIAPPIVLSMEAA